MCRNIPRDQLEFTNKNGYTVRVVPHPCSACAIELFDWIWRSDKYDQKIVIVFPNSWHEMYEPVTAMCNFFNVSARNLHAFCMDEWADEDGNVAPVTYVPSLGGHFLREFYLQLREDLRPPLRQIHYYTNENIGCYSDLIAEEGNGGADLSIYRFQDQGLQGRQSGRLPEDQAGFVDNHRLTITQNSGCFGDGDVYHTPAYSVSIGPWDVVHAKDHLELDELGFCGGYSSWERTISRLQIYGPVTKDLPASVYQMTKGTIYLSEDMARPIQPMDLVAF